MTCDPRGTLTALCQCAKGCGKLGQCMWSERWPRDVTGKWPVRRRSTRRSIAGVRESRCRGKEGG